MNRITETVIANTITIVIILTVFYITSIEVKREYIHKSRALVTSYSLKFF
jgi:hypothetical protein